MLGDRLRKGEALLAEGVLHQLQQDLGLGTLVVVLVGGNVVLQIDNGVLPLAHLHVHFVGVIVALVRRTEDVGGEAVDRLAGNAVDMDGNKKLRVRVRGDFGTGVEGDEDVLVPRHHDLDLGIGFADPRGEHAGDLERQGLLRGLLVRAHGPGVLPAVAGVDDDGVEPQVG